MPAHRKPPGARRRRNADQQDWITLPAEGPKGDPPALPGDETDWLDSTRTWWAAIWKSPQAHMWPESDRRGLVRLARLHDMEESGDLPVSAYSEITKLETYYGLNPEGRQRRGWLLPDPAPKTGPTPIQSAPSAKKRTRPAAV